MKNGIIHHEIISGQVKLLKTNQQKSQNKTKWVSMGKWLSVSLGTNWLELESPCSDLKTSKTKQNNTDEEKFELRVVCNKVSKPPHRRKIPQKYKTMNLNIP